MLATVETLGEQVVTWRATDASLNRQEKSITVVVRDPTRPIIVLQGDVPLIWPAGVPFEDPGAVIDDPYESDLNNLLQSNAAEVVDVNTINDYVAFYQMTEPDSQGLKAAQVSRVIKVRDTVAPVRAPGTGRQKRACFFFHERIVVLIHTHFSSPARSLRLSEAAA